MAAWTSDMSWGRDRLLHVGRLSFTFVQCVAPLLQVGRFPVHPIAQGLVDATFVIDVGVL